MHAQNVEGEGGSIVDTVELSLPTDGTRVDNGEKYPRLHMQQEVH